MSAPIIIRIFDLVEGDVGFAVRDGQRVHDQVALLLRAGKTVVLSFEQMEMVTAVFLNVVIGQLYGKFSEAQIRELLSVQGMEADDQAVLKLVVENAKRYFAFLPPEKNLKLMTKEQLTALTGKTVKFSSGVDEFESGFENGMFGVVEKVTWEVEDVCCLWVNFSKFEEHNKQLMTANYFDADGKPTRRWCETGYYPEDKIEKLYVGADTELEFLTVVADGPSARVLVVTKEQREELLDLAERVGHPVGSGPLTSPGNAEQLADEVRKLLA